MSILAWIILGLLAGWIASLIVKGSGYGVIWDMVIGIVGALIGGWLGSVLFGLSVTGFNLTSLLLAIIGAIILLAIYRAVVGARRRPV